MHFEDSELTKVDAAYDRAWDHFVCTRLTAESLLESRDRLARPMSSAPRPVSATNGVLLAKLSLVSRSHIGGNSTGARRRQSAQTLEPPWRGRCSPTGNVRYSGPWRCAVLERGCGRGRPGVRSCANDEKSYPSEVQRPCC
jgi:hypothetical protein